MMGNAPAGIESGMADFWAVYDEHYDALRMQMIDDSAIAPELSALLSRVPEEEQQRQGRISRDMLRRAVQSGDWEPYLEYLRVQGTAYAELDLSFPALLALTTSFQSQVLPRLLEAYADEPERLMGALQALAWFATRALGTIGEAYLDKQQETIARQHQAIDELSTPVLQLREGLLLQPVIGVLDSTRARQLMQSLLEAIRERRGRVVVIDITGVTEVDTEVANRLLQAAQAARLMGTSVLVTGLSAGVAKALVTLGVDLGRLRTMGALEDGILEANRLLGYRVVADTATASGGAGGRQ